VEIAWPFSSAAMAGPAGRALIIGVTVESCVTISKVYLRPEIGFCIATAAVLPTRRVRSRSPNPHLMSERFCSARAGQRPIRIARHNAWAIKKL